MGDAMTYIYVPSGGGVWPPPGEPIGSYDMHVHARQAASVLAQNGIPAEELTVLSVTGWRSAGDRIAGLLGAYLAVIAALMLVLGIASAEPLHTWVLIPAGLIGLAVLVAVVVAVLFRRRARRFLNSFAPPVVGRHVLLCASGRAQEARDLLADLRTGGPTSN
jgi:hypothetical protein